MKCQRCFSDQPAAYRVYTDALDMKVCAMCAGEALELGIAVEVLSAEKGKARSVSLDSGIVA